MSRRARLAKAARRRRAPRIVWRFDVDVTPAVTALDTFGHDWAGRSRSACHRCLTRTGRLPVIHAAYHRRRKARTRRNR